MRGRWDDRPYWVCSCGGWTHVHKSVTACFQCGKAPSPEAVDKLRDSSTSAAYKAGGVPAQAAEQPSGDEDGFVEQPKGKRKQGRARGKAQMLAQPAMQHNSGHDDAPGASMEVESSLSLHQQLEKAKRRVAAMEAVGEDARDGVPDFELLLRDARDRRDQLQKERRAARPVQWRLVEAESVSKSKSDALEKANKRRAELAQEQERVRDAIASADLEIQHARQALSEADSALAAVRAELAADIKPFEDEQLVRSVEGLGHQLSSLRAAAMAGNLEVALAAVESQHAAVLAHFSRDGAEVVAQPTPAPIPPQQVAGVPASTAANQASNPVYYEQWSTSNHRCDQRSARSSRTSSSGSSRTRSDKRHLTLEERAAIASSSRLEDYGFHARASDDPYASSPSG